MGRKKKEELITKTNGVKARKGKIVQALQELEDENGGILTPHIVVDSARNISSPLHSAFDWDDTSAAEKYRLMQARILLTTIKVEFMGEKREAYFNAKAMVGKEMTRAYFPIQTVYSNQKLHDEVLREAVRELEYAQAKYESLKEMRGVINTKKLQQVKRKIS